MSAISKINSAFMKPPLIGRDRSVTATVNQDLSRSLLNKSAWRATFQEALNNKDNFKIAERQKVHDCRHCRQCCPHPSAGDNPVEISKFSATVKPEDVIGLDQSCGVV